MGTHPIDHASFRKIAEFIRFKSGIVLDETKSYLIETRLGPLLDELQIDSYLELCRSASRDQRVLNRLLDEITTNETSFFRDRSPFELLKFKLLPELMDRRGASTQPINIWSAASSTGQEVYSIAMACSEILPAQALARVRLVGTDLSRQAVERASRGEYNLFELERGLDATLRQRHFREQGGRWRVRDELRALASFRQLNLLEPFGSLGAFDIVFCRNVAIYFQLETRRQLFERIARQLKPGGTLVIGSSETLQGVTSHFERRMHMNCAYYLVTC